MSCTGLTSRGSNVTPITMSLPFGPRPSNSPDIAFELGAVAARRPAFAMLPLGLSLGYQRTRLLRASLLAPRFRNRGQSQPPCNQTCWRIEFRGDLDRRRPAR